MNFLYRLRQKMSSMKICTKVICIVLGVTVMLTLLSMFYVHNTLRNALGNQLDQKATSIARDITSRSMEPFLTNDIFKLYQLAHNTLESYDDVIYVFFMDDNGNILIHTFEEYFPTELLEIEHEIGSKGPSIRIFQAEEGVLRDVAAPVFSGPKPEKIGRVGLIDYSLQEALAAATRQLLFISGLTFITASFIVYFLINYTTVKPLNSLVYSVQAVAQGNLSQKFIVKSGDELSILAKAFNSMTEQLSHAQQAQNRLMKKIIHSQEEERKRISRELHDETGQMLSTLMISLHFLEKSNNLHEMKQKTAEFRQILLQSLRQVRLLAQKLTPAPLIDLGLKAATEELINKYRDSVDWEINLQIEVLDHVQLPQEIELSIYRVTQETFTNIARHAHAKKVDLFMGRHEDKLLITFKDDGVGFNTEKLKKENEIHSRLGLITMQERISLVGGRLEINSTPGKGTVLYICIPIPPLEEDEARC